MPKRVLILGGTTEGRELASLLAEDPRFEVEVSLAGRTESIRDQGAPTRIGGFGGTAGLVAYLRAERIAALVDATHPFAAIMSEHASDASRISGVPFIALRRSTWEPRSQDRWIEVPDVEGALEALPGAPRRVFLALGRKEVHAFAAAPQHFYLVRSVDPVVPPLDVDDAHYVVARGPFAAADERKLLEQHGIQIVISRNSGGSAAYGKIEAARSLNLPVVMIRRPRLPEVETVTEVPAVVRWLLQGFSAGGSPSSS